MKPEVHHALWAQFVAPILDGVDGVVRQIRLPANSQLDDIFAVGSVVTDVRTPNRHYVVATGAGWTALADRWDGTDVTVWVRGTDLEAVEKAVAVISAEAPLVADDESTVALDFWQSSGSMYTTSRTIAAPRWNDIALHYPSDVRTQIARLLVHDLDDRSGRIVLWHGPPGTGKTTAIRAWAKEWESRALFQVVLDPEAMLQRAANLMTVLMDESDTDHDWRVLVIEDADDLLRANTNDNIGQTMSRLLNVGDGILGQGVKVLVLMTTNRPVHLLHPALSRPGRCLAQVAFRRFSRAEARAWHGDDLPPGAELSLAEIISGVAHADSAPHPGQYL